VFRVIVLGEVSPMQNTNPKSAGINHENVEGAGFRPVLIALGKQKHRDVEEILLDGAKLRDFSVQDAQDIADHCHGAYLLSLNQCRIRDLVHLPYLTSIEVLELQDNKLSDSSNLHLIAERLPNVTELLLSGNHIQELESLSFILKLPKLENLEICLCPAVDKYPDYRNQLFQACPHLQRIDNVLRGGVKADSDQEDVEAEAIEEADDAKGDSVEDAVEREKRRQALADFYEKDLEEDDEDEDFDGEADDGEGASDDLMLDEYTHSHSRSIEED